MKSLTMVLILLAFLQSVLMPINLVLIVLLCREFVVGQKINLYLAFGIGVLLSILFGQRVGLVSLEYLLFIFIASLVKLSAISTHLISVAVIVSALVFLDQLFSRLTLGSPLNLTIIITSVLLVIPIYIVVKLWEERFVVTKERKLKLS